MGRAKIAAVKCEGKTVKGVRCRRKTIPTSGTKIHLCGVCKGRSDRQEKRLRKREKRQKDGRGKAGEPQGGTVSLLAHNLTSVWDTLYAEANSDLAETLRRVYPKMVGVRSRSGVEFMGVNRWWLAARAMDKNWESSEWGTPSQWRRLGGKLPGDTEGTHVLLHTQGEGKSFPRAITLYNRSQVQFEGEPPPQSQQPAVERDHKEVFDDLVSGLGARMGVSISSGMDAEERPGVFYPPRADAITLDAPDLAESDVEQILQLLHEAIHQTGPQVGRPRTNAMEEELAAMFGTAEAAARLGIPLVGDPGGYHSQHREGWHRESQSDQELLMRVTSLAGDAVKHLADRKVLPSNGP